MAISFDVAAIEAMSEAVRGPSITPTANQHDMGPVAGIDTVSASVWAWWDQADHEYFTELLRDAQERGKISGQSEFVEWRGLLVEVKPSGTRHGGGMSYQFLIDGIYFAIGKKHSPGQRHNLQCSAQGAVMLQHAWGYRQVWDHIQSIMHQLGVVTIEKYSLSRLDAFADCVGVHVKSFRPLAINNRFVCRARHFAQFNGIDLDLVQKVCRESFADGFDALVASVRAIWESATADAVEAICKEAASGAFDMASFGKTNEDLGWQFGRGNTVCRIYNKVRQLEKFHPERLGIMYDAWEIEHGTPVTRVEFQLRGPALRDKQITTFDDLDKLLPSLVHYLTHDWIVGLSKYDGANKKRRKVHPVWKRVQAYFKLGFDGRRRKLQRRQIELKDNGDHVAKMGLSFVVSATAKNTGACVDATDLRQTAIQEMDKAAERVGGYEVLLQKQCKVAFRFANTLGIPFKRDTARQSVLAAIDQLHLETCATPETPLHPAYRAPMITGVFN